MSPAAHGRLIAVCGVVAATVVGAPSALSTSPAADSDRLKTSAISKLLSGGARLRSLPIGASPSATRREYFRPDGTYQGCADRFPILGAYKISGDRLCTATRAGTSCRELYRRPDGGYEQSFPGTYPGTRQPVEITGSSNEACETLGVTP